MSQTVGSIDALWRFPVKSMQGEQLEEAELTVVRKTGTVRTGDAVVLR